MTLSFWCLLIAALLLLRLTMLWQTMDQVTGLSLSCLRKTSAVSLFLILCVFCLL